MRLVCLSLQQFFKNNLVLRPSESKLHLGWRDLTMSQKCVGSVEPRSRSLLLFKIGIKSSGFAFVGIIDSEISTPMFTKKSLKAMLIHCGSVSFTP